MLRILRAKAETTKGFCLNNEASGHSKTGCFIKASLSCVLKIEHGDSCPPPPNLLPQDVFNALTSMSLSQINRMDSGCCLITDKWIMNHTSVCLTCCSCTVGLLLSVEV